MATILIANADLPFSQMLTHVLSADGHEIVLARTGEETVQRVEEQAPAVVLLDLAILGLPGLEVLVKLRARAPHMPVVVVTGEVPIEVENRAREMGVSDVLRKRLNMDVILQAVHRALQEAGKPTQAKPSAVASAGTDSKPATILLVDDEREICDLVGEFLQRCGYRIQKAYSGTEALAKVKQEPPNLILLDIYMPDLNGVEVLKRLKAMHSSVGVMIVTASQDDPLLKKALELGAFDILSKPMDLAQLERAVSLKLLSSRPE